MVLKARGTIAAVHFAPQEPGGGSRLLIWLNLSVRATTNDSVLPRGSLTKVIEAGVLYMA